MARHKMLLIVDKLLERSGRREVDWIGREEANKFVVTYKYSSFTIGSDEVEPEFYKISVMNEDGVEVDSLDFTDPIDDDYELVGELYRLAKVKAIKIDEVLDSLLEEIDL